MSNIMDELKVKITQHHGESSLTKLEFFMNSAPMPDDYWMSQWRGREITHAKNVSSYRQRDDIHGIVEYKYEFAVAMMTKVLEELEKKTTTW